GRVTITARNLRARDVRIEAGQFDASGDLHLRAGRPFGMNANATGHLRTSRGELALEAHTQGTFDRLAIEARSTSPSEAQAEALLTRAGEQWKLVGQVSSPAFSFSPWLERPPFSLSAVDLDFEADR